MHRRGAAATNKPSSAHQDGGGGGGGAVNRHASMSKQLRKENSTRTLLKKVPRSVAYLILSIPLWLLLFHWYSHSGGSGNNGNGAGAIRRNQQSQQKGEGGPTYKDDEIVKMSGLDVIKIRSIMSSIREEFYARYGGKDAALTYYRKGIQPFGKIEQTAKRILRSVMPTMDKTKTTTKRKPFTLSFGGYSVTVGRGNYLNQSYPFVMERVLQPLFDIGMAADSTSSSTSTGIVVRNAAIGGIPSFPYGFCFQHFLGIDSDVVSWDYSMNEKGGDASVLEAYIRQSQAQLPHTKPMMIVLDTNKNRCQLLKTYASLGLIGDAVCVGRASDIIERSFLKELNNEKQDENEAELARQLERPPPGMEHPPGFQNWNDFGAPSGCPGKGSWHPKLKEHELIGWVLAMYFVDAYEYAISHIVSKYPSTWKERVIDNDDSGTVTFPAPLSANKLPNNNPHVTQLLYGYNSKSGKKKSDEYIMKHVSCRTSFLPAIDQEKVIPSVVVSGWNEQEGTENILETRSDDAYKAGWVLDVSKVERDTKLKVEGKNCGGLGYIDMKIALYGIPESGPLKLWLPSHTTSHTDVKTANSKEASQYFTSNLIFCEANEKRPTEACQLDTDITYTVGGIKATNIQMISGAAEYLKRKTCVHVEIPSEARVSTMAEIVASSSTTMNENVKSRLLAGITSQSSATNDATKENHVGLVVDIEITGKKVNRKDGACCISHIVWENQ